MALMKSNSGTSKGSGFFTDGMFVTRYGTDAVKLNRAAAVLGFDPVSVKHETVVQEIARVDTNRALLVKETAEAVALILQGGTVDIDEAAIARAVEKQLADDFATVNANVNRPRTVS